MKRAFALTQTALPLALELGYGPMNFSFPVDPKGANPAAEFRVKTFAPCAHIVPQAFPRSPLPD